MRKRLPYAHVQASNRASSHARGIKAPDAPTATACAFNTSFLFGVARSRRHLLHALSDEHCGNARNHYFFRVKLVMVGALTALLAATVIICDITQSRLHNTMLVVTLLWLVLRNCLLAYYELFLLCQACGSFQMNTPSMWFWLSLFVARRGVVSVCFAGHRLFVQQM